MPALTAFKRQWNISSDDFVFPGISMLLIRGCWFIAVVAVYFTHHQHFTGCTDGVVLSIFFIGMICLLAAKIVTNIFLTFHSSRGSIKDCSLRRNVAKVLYVKLTLFILEVAWLLIGSYWSSKEYNTCDLIVIYTVRVLVGLSWIGVLVFAVMFVFLFSPLGNDPSSLDGSNVWKKRCRLICCAYRKEDSHTSDAYSDVANLVSVYFQGVDLVPSDIVAGLLLVGRQQNRARDRGNSDESATHHVYGDRHDVLDITDSVRSIVPPTAQWMNVHKATKVMRFALAVYGWPFYSFTHMPFGCCVLCCTTPRMSLGKEQIEGSDCCSCNLVSMEKHMDESCCSSEIYYTSFVNELFVNPFSIFLDHEQKAVIVAIRGTLSPKDALMDLTALGECIHDTFPKTYEAHKGMTKSARNLMERLKIDNLLINAFTGQCAAYDLIICGHSLGAGVAAVLSMLMKADYPHLQCFAYSPPGGLLSEDAYKASMEYTMSIILGDDLVPRLSIQTMQDLKVNLMTALNDSPHPKYQIFFSLPFRALRCNHCLLDEDESSMTRPLVQNSRSRQNSYTLEANTTHNSGIQEAVESRDLLMIQPPFYAPGCIMYITPTHDANDRSYCSSGSEYTWRWADQSEFLTLQVTPRMGGDHLPDHVLDALNKLISDYPEAILTERSPAVHT